MTIVKSIQPYLLVRVPRDCSAFSESCLMEKSNYAFVSQKLKTGSVILAALISMHSQIRRMANS